MGVLGHSPVRRNLTLNPKFVLRDKTMEQSSLSTLWISLLNTVFASIASMVWYLVKAEEKQARTTARTVDHVNIVETVEQRRKQQTLSPMRRSISTYNLFSALTTTSSITQNIVFMTQNLKRMLSSSMSNTKKSNQKMLPIL